MPVKSKIDVTERKKRAQAITSALASVRIEHMDPGPEALAISERFVEGDLTIEEFGIQIGELERRVATNGR